ncbi:hypothetical protein STRIP9103_09382 [Streptomyces ipomoeae 91-03]|uniref:Uncharacterized protein n=1 Tax=Streptomyces ipomoeae 91-03 TaxID=698759 RepID=L1L757_9ACTN|nr:hypothetical protein STRIP9103_09382 [Streptomyces ipomoeae 91-03]
MMVWGTPEQDASPSRRAGLAGISSATGTLPHARWPVVRPPRCSSRPRPAPAADARLGPSAICGIELDQVEGVRELRTWTSS